MNYNELEALGFDTCVAGHFEHFEPMTKKQLLDGFRERLSKL